VHAGAPHVNPKAATNTPANSATPQTVHAKPTPHPHVVPTVVVDNPTPAPPRCRHQQGGDGCKKQKDDPPTAWSTLRRWLQIGQQ